MKKPRSLLETRGFNNHSMVPSHMVIDPQIIITGYIRHSHYHDFLKNANMKQEINGQLFREISRTLNEL